MTMRKVRNKEQQNWKLEKQQITFENSLYQRPKSII